MIPGFDTRKLTLKNKVYEFMWIASDVGCFQIISNDWMEMNPIIMKHTPERTAVVQAGGNCGMYPLLHSEQFSHVYTFEPDPMNFFCLANNCKGNRIIKFNTAVGDVHGMLTIGSPSVINVGMHKIGAGNVSVYSMTIDSLNLPHLSLLHLDIEGYELNAVKGAINTINKFRPTVVLEISDQKEETLGLMEQLKYTKVYSNVGNSANYIFVPTERA